MRLFGPYYYGKHKWENYLLDIQDAIESKETAIEQTGRLQTKALGALNQQQLSEMRQQTEQMRGIESALQSGFEEMGAEFE